MKILLDTHVFIWAIMESNKLTAVHRSGFLNKDNDLFLSTASLWEAVIKSGLGKLSMPKPATKYLLSQMEKSRISILPILSAHLTELESLPPVHRDPFDRMIVAQARSERMSLMSGDPVMKEYGVKLL